MKMGPTKRNNTKAPDLNKRRRRVYSLQEKVEMIKKIYDGASFAGVGREFGVNESTIRSIYKVRGDIMNAFTDAAPRSVNRIVRVHKDAFIQPMEKGVYLWMQDCYSKRLPVSTKRIQDRAKQIYKSLVELSDVVDKDKYTFQGSRGWVQKFIKRYNLASKLVPGDATSDDTETTRRYLEEFYKMMNEGGYLPCQVFNAVETALYWKKMPEKSYVAKEEARTTGFKDAKDRVSLLFCCNGSGDFKAKPLLIHHSARPSPFQNISMLTLPVHWRANKNGWMTKVIFEEWFMTHFRAEVKEYCARKNISFKAILVLDNCPGYSTNLNDLQNEIKVIYLPPNTRTLLQPMNQEVMATFKLLYLDLTFENIHKALVDDEELTVRQYLKRFNILHGVRFIGKAWQAVNQGCLLNGWRNLLPDTTPDFVGFEEDNMTRVLNMAKALPGDGFQELDETDIWDMMEAPERELNDTEVLELVDERQNDIGTEDDDCVESSPTLTMSNLKKIMSYYEQLTQLIQEADPSFERKESVTAILDRGIAPYKEIYRERQALNKQSMITPLFGSFSDSPAPQKEEPVASRYGALTIRSSTPRIQVNNIDSDSKPDFSGILSLPQSAPTNNNDNTEDVDKM
eukprot:XP_014768235.1 PREDICTED: tigger transposable element-derived protein 1-like [Octopus bimaculoides]